MTPGEARTLALACLAGAAAGTLFFGGLWWTVRKALPSRRPARWFVGSLLLRTTVALACFHLVGSGRWERYAACLAGFLAARLLVSSATRPAAGKHPLPALDGNHAP